MHKTQDAVLVPCCPGCPGWGWFNGREIQRCDACERFPNDAAARRYVWGSRAERRRLKAWQAAKEAASA